MIKRGQTVAVGLSGGADSVCLLLSACEKSEKLGFKTVAVNVEHGIRGQSSVNDSAFCKKLCDELGVKLYSFSVDAPDHAFKNGLSLEQAARKLRYDCFFECIEKGLCDVVAVAHHLSDNAETVLFNILRGAGLKGAAGIPASSYGGKIVRPLLNCKKEDLLSYLEEKNASFVTDESNFDLNFTRNALRLDVLPNIKRYFPQAENSLVRFGAAAKEDDDYLNMLAEKELSAVPGGYAISVNAPYPLFSRALISALKKLGVEKDYEKRHVDDVFALTHNQTGKEIHLPKNVYAVKVYDRVEIRTKSADNRPIAPFLLGETVIDRRVLKAERIEASAVVFGDGLYFDLDKLPKACVIRKKEDGDVFTKFNGQTVTLKKYLTDKKIPSVEKKSLLVLAKEKTVFAIANIEISSFIKIDKHTTNIIKLSCITKEV